MGAFLIEAFAFCSEFGFGLAFLTEPLTLSAGFLSFLLDPEEEVGGQLELLDAQRMEIGAHPHLHHRTQPGDGLHRRPQALLRGLDRPSAQRTHAVVGLRVVGAEHQLGEVGGHLAALSQRVVVGEPLGGLDGRLGPDDVLDALTDLGEALLVGVSVLQRVVVLIDPDLLEQDGVVELDELTASSRHVRSHSGGVGPGRGLGGLLGGGLGPGGIQLGGGRIGAGTCLDHLPAFLRELSA